MKKTRKVLILALMYEALAVFCMQVLRWTYTWVFVALYWMILTAKNLVDWIIEQAKEREQDAVE